MDTKKQSEKQREMPEIEQFPKVRKQTKLRKWLFDRGITQEWIREQTMLSRHCVVSMVNGTAKTNDSNKLLVAKVLGLSWEEMQKLLSK